MGDGVELSALQNRMPAGCRFGLHRLASTLAVVTAVMLIGCAGKDTYIGRTRGGGIVIDESGSIAVAVNRGAGVITVLKLDSERYPASIVRGQTRLDVGAEAEPWAAVVDAKEDTAYVVLRGTGRVARIVNLSTAPTLNGSVLVGSEPTAIAITPSGARVFVANWGEGTISVITTSDFQARSKVDLNAALAGTEVLGAVEARFGLAHPRALAMTDDGDTDDSDETLYATEFFSQPIPGVLPEADHRQIDSNRQGFVYAMSVATGHVAAPIPLAPVDDTGFADSNNAKTGCFPNQLYAATIDAGRLYVTSLCASPRGPVGPGTEDPTNFANFKTLVHPTVFVIDTTINQELPEARRVLTRELEALHQADEAASDANVDSEIRMPLIPNDIVFEPNDDSGNERHAWITALGADASFRLGYGADGAPISIGSTGKRHLALFDKDIENSRGTLPIGIAVGQARRPYALVLNEGTYNVVVVDLETESLVSGNVTAPDMKATAAAEPSATRGRELFATGLRDWSFRGQAWSSCESCHPDGGSDGVTWYFPRGPRRTISTASTYDGATAPKQRTLLWTANIDEVHDIEAVVRGISGGVGAITWNYGAESTDCRLLYDGVSVDGGGVGECPAPKTTTYLHNGLNGSLSELTPRSDEGCLPTESTCDVIPRLDWNHIDAFIRTVRAPQRLDSNDEDTALGAELFEEARCGGCHAGPAWTLGTRFYQPSTSNNGALPFNGSVGSVGRLRELTYSVPTELMALNMPGSSGTAPFISTDGKQINCVLRSVGTFPSQPPDGGPNLVSVAALGANRVVETQADMKTLGVGASGFNIPSLLGLATGAPYFHAGNARTLEELFSPAFAGHYQALAPEFLPDGDPGREAKIRALVAFLLTLDDAFPALEPPTLSFNPDLCGNAWTEP